MAVISVQLMLNDSGEYLRALEKVVQAPEITSCTEDEEQLCIGFEIDMGYIPIDGSTAMCYIG